jgi:hypothetical protein
MTSPRASLRQAEVSAKLRLRSGGEGEAPHEHGGGTDDRSEQREELFNLPA